MKLAVSAIDPNSKDSNVIFVAGKKECLGRIPPGHDRIWAKADF